MIFFSEEQMKKVVKEIGLEVDKILPNYRFYKYQKRWWIRKLGWKTDGIRLSRTFSGVLFNFEVGIPPVKNLTLCLCTDLAHTNLGLLYGIPGAAHEFPKFSWQYEKFKQRVISDFMKGLEWFSNFDTPKLCWEYMEKNVWDINAPASKYAKAYLYFLSEHPERLQLDYKHEYNFPSESERALFDVDYNKPLSNMPGEDDSFISELNKD
jgi:hypothetical protein